MLAKNDDQHEFYDPGVGTIGQLATWGRLAQKAKVFFGLATGFGLDDKILRAYRWLCASYRDGDRIFLFGFSRGAYTVGPLAGLINMIGLLIADQASITGSPHTNALPSSMTCRSPGSSSEAEAGNILLPLEAPWLDTFRAELKAFPNGKHDDQVDISVR